MKKIKVTLPTAIFLEVVFIIAGFCNRYYFNLAILNGIILFIHLAYIFLNSYNDSTFAVSDFNTNVKKLVKDVSSPDIQQKYSALIVLYNMCREPKNRKKLDEAFEKITDNYGNKFSYDAVMELIMYNYKKTCEDIARGKNLSEYQRQFVCNIENNK